MAFNRCGITTIWPVSLAEWNSREWPASDLAAPRRLATFRPRPSAASVTEASVCETHHEGQGDVEASDIGIVEATYRSRDPRSSNSHWLVGHDLGSGPQTISFARIDRDTKIRRLDDFRRHLTDDNRKMRFRKRISLDDHGWPRFAVVAGRGDDHDVTALHRPIAGRACQTRKPLRSSSARRPHCFRRDERPRRPCAGGQTVGVNRERRDAVRASPACAVSHAPSSFVRQARTSRLSFRLLQRLPV
jgi:hypothetical protein